MSKMKASKKTNKVRKTAPSKNSTVFRLSNKLGVTLYRNGIKLLSLGQL